MDEQLFGRRDQQAQQAPGQANLGVSEIATRLKLAEQRYANLQKRNQLTEDAFLQFERDMRSEVRALTQRSVELRRQITEINEKIDVMLGELGKVVKRHEFAVVERYLDMWQPMKFITHDEARKMIKDLKEA